MLPKELKEAASGTALRFNPQKNRQNPSSFGT